ncbi:glycoside hydrolase family 3 C-terminal domain-containing protein [Halalkalibacter sp. APA_J-10(15)]|uniref:glycoside hydrolase family 3 C-terminal domain-containing protein n=1 Tax=Halalkalibacter sp. APA_J-10(15) TaxID=2933805 RepID=UPI001FF17593|nr:glycoside hydrolase family 3 C-terminal domain-containing protein [Halalkalibacter sp. APA_J-10(15)]MCK0473040.1 glycoside hydrolase family 3 C-terminal domain-containing protein [Halalkalibacter sp. APA_J-10(15)]
MEFLFRNHNLELEERLNDLVSRLTLEEKIHLMPTKQQSIKRLGIQEYVIGGEAAHGIAWLGKATTFPQPIGLSCTWNPKLLYKIGEAIGNEARVFYQKFNKRKGLTLWAPTVDLERDPRWGRTEEGYGEDPLLTGIMARSLVEGMQGDHPFYKRTISTIKHYMGNNNEKDRLHSSSNIDNRNKFEYYIKPFKYLIENDGAYSIMPAYNSVNDLPCILDPDLKELIKDKWGLKGYIVGDAGDMGMTVDFHKYCSTYSEAVSLAIKSGVDSINDDVELVVKSIKEALQQKLLYESDLDVAIKNVFRGRMQLGEFDPDYLNPYSNIPENILCSNAHSKLSLEAAKEAIVLLKNETNILPLNKNEHKNIAVIGPLSNVLFRDWYSGDFPYKVTPLQGIKEYGEDKVKHHNGSDLIAIKSKHTGLFFSVDEKTGEIKANSNTISKNETFEITNWGWGKNTLISSANNKFLTFKRKLSATAEEAFGWFVNELFNIIQTKYGYKLETWNKKTLCIDNEEIIQKAKDDLKSHENELFEIVKISNGLECAQNIAKNSDSVVIFVGNNPLINGKEDEDRPDITLPKNQKSLIDTIYEVNRNVILCIIGSYPFSGINDNISSILYTSHGSQEIGNALSKVIFGEYSPSGKLTMTWYRDVQKLPDIMDYDIIKGERTYLYHKGNILYPFGHGLTYSSFSYSDLKMHINNFRSNIKVSFRLINIGSIASDEVVQVYFKCNSKNIVRPLKELKAFKRVHLLPGESRIIKFYISVDELTYWDFTQNKYTLESAVYTVFVGSSSEDIRLFGDLKLKGETKSKERNLEIKTRAENYDDYNNANLRKSINGIQVVHSENKNTWIMFKSKTLKINRIMRINVKSIHTNSTIQIRRDKPNGDILGKSLVKTINAWNIVDIKLENKKEYSNVKLYLLLDKGISIDWLELIK